VTERVEFAAVFAMSLHWRCTFVFDVVTQRLRGASGAVVDFAALFARSRIAFARRLEIFQCKPEVISYSALVRLG
jgi:hypothetical protein